MINKYIPNKWLLHAHPKGNSKNRPVESQEWKNLILEQQKFLQQHGKQHPQPAESQKEKTLLH